MEEHARNAKGQPYQTSAGKSLQTFLFMKSIAS